MIYFDFKLEKSFLLFYLSNWGIDFKTHSHPLNSKLIIIAVNKFQNKIE